MSAGSVVAGAGLVLSTPAPVGPGPDVIVGVRVSQDQMHEQAADLGYRESDHALIIDSDSPFAAWVFVPASQARASIDKVVWACQAR
ncbi:hypothetical protein M2280_005244 [Prescottella agglutinans]|uniref:Uncharacterized protein n=1 Tax=Prescottella agglutinans TaxID=1644129 RepID=A0ABT6MI44_9NOCA|nr:hypothetical protein [Prescottella agglutinans]